MARLLTVVNERKKLRSEYRRHLEDQYIAKCKAAEAEQLQADLDARRESGEKTPLTPLELKDMLRSRSEQKQQKISTIQEDLIERFESSAERAPLLDTSDIAFMAQSQVKLSQRDILGMHVKNPGSLTLKQRRQVMGHI